MRERPWLMRTYAGHTSAAESNALFRRNLAKGQTGLSVAFDLPTPTGYDPDHELARGEVGRGAVPVAVTPKVAIAPARWTRLCGWAVIAGGTKTVSVTSALSTAPTALLTRTL